MIILSTTRRASKSAAEKVRVALIELDELFQTYQVFQYPIDDQVAAQSVYLIVRDGKEYVVALDDPTLI